MNLLTKSCVDKIVKNSTKIEFSHGKLNVLPVTGKDSELRFPLSFTPYKTIIITAVSKKFGPANSSATIGVDFYRRGKLFCCDDSVGKVIIDGDNYSEYKLAYFIPFGVDEAYVVIRGTSGATVSVLAMTVETGSAPAAGQEDSYDCVADGGLSAYAPKNTMPALLAAMRAGFRKIIVDADVTYDGHIICYDGAPLARVSDGEGEAKDKTLEHLKTLDFGAFADTFYKNTRISTLAEALMQFSGEGITPFIRINRDGFPTEKLREILGEFSFEKIYFMTGDEKLRQQLKTLFPAAGFACPSLYYCARGENNACDYAKMSEQGVEIIPVINYPEELKKFVASGEKSMITSVYQLRGCKPV